MGEQQLPKVLIQQLSFCAEQPDRHIAKAQSLHIRAVSARCLQRNQTALLGNDGMSQLRCHAVAVTG